MNTFVENRSFGVYLDAYGGFGSDTGASTFNQRSYDYVNQGNQFLSWNGVSVNQNSAEFYHDAYGGFGTGNQANIRMGGSYECEARKEQQHFWLGTYPENQNSAMNYRSFGSDTGASTFNQRSYDYVNQGNQFLSWNGVSVNQNSAEFYHDAYGGFGTGNQANIRMGGSYESEARKEQQHFWLGTYPENQNSAMNYRSFGSDTGASTFNQRSYDYVNQANEFASRNRNLENRNLTLNYRQTYGNFANENSLENDISSKSNAPSVHQALTSNTESKPVKPTILNQPLRIPENNQPAPLAIAPKYGVGCDNLQMFVKTSDQPSKKLCCPYCGKPIVKLARHLEAMHKREPDVQKFLSLEKGSKERREIQDGLRKTGTLHWNKNAKINKNELITSRRPNAKFGRDATYFRTCPYCHGSYARSGLGQHVAKKHKNTKSEATKGERVITALSAVVEGRCHYKASENLKKLFTTLRQNKILYLIRFDWLLIVFGNKICIKHNKPYQKGLKSYRLRMAGRILEALRSIEPDVTDFASIYQPKFYDKLVEAIRIVSKFDDVSNEYNAPACASTAVTLVRQIGLLLIAEYIKKGEADNQRKTKNFMTVMNSDIGDSINRGVIETQRSMRREKIINLPTTDDVKLLWRYVDSERNNYFKELTSKYSITSWIKLAELTVLSIIIFNRKRVGETRNILVANFEKRQSIDEKTCGKLFSSLPARSKRVASQYCRMVVRGKRDSTVHVLLKPLFVECIILLLKNRQHAGISTKNKFLFALPSSIDNDKTVDSCKIMNKYARECGASNPSSLVGTNLRKHMATVCVSMDLDDSVVADVAKFMGHAEKVHRDYYRQNLIDREVVQMSRVLEAALGNSDDSSDDESSETISEDGKHLGDLQMKPKKTTRKRNMCHQSASDSNDRAAAEEKEHGLEMRNLNGLTEEEIKELLPRICDRHQLKDAIKRKHVQEENEPKQRTSNSVDGMSGHTSSHVSVERKRNDVTKKVDSMPSRSNGSIDRSIDRCKRNDSRKKQAIVQILKTNHAQRAALIEMAETMFASFDPPIVMEEYNRPGFVLIDVDEGKISCPLCFSKYVIQTRKTIIFKWQVDNMCRHLLNDHSLIKATAFGSATSDGDVDFDDRVNGINSILEVVMDDREVEETIVQDIVQSQGIQQDIPASEIIQQEQDAAGEIIQKDIAESEMAVQESATLDTVASSSPTVVDESVEQFIEKVVVPNASSENKQSNRKPKASVGMQKLKKLRSPRDQKDAHVRKQNVKSSTDTRGSARQPKKLSAGKVSVSKAKRTKSSVSEKMDLEAPTDTVASSTKTVVDESVVHQMDLVAMRTLDQEKTMGKEVAVEENIQPIKMTRQRKQNTKYLSHAWSV